MSIGELFNDIHQDNDEKGFVQSRSRLADESLQQIAERFKKPPLFPDDERNQRLIHEPRTRIQLEAAPEAAALIRAGPRGIANDLPPVAVGGDGDSGLENVQAHATSGHRVEVALNTDNRKIGILISPHKFRYCLLDPITGQPQDRSQLIVG